MDGQTIILHSPSQRSFAKQMIEKAPPDYVVNITQQKRSNDQNAKMWAMLSDVSRAKPEGRHWTTQAWKAAFMHLLGHQVQFCEGLDNSGPFPMGFKTSHLTKKQMSDLIETIYEYGSRHGVVWTEPIDSPADTSSPAEDAGGEPAIAKDSGSPSISDGDRALIGRYGVALLSAIENCDSDKAAKQTLVKNIHETWKGDQLSGAPDDVLAIAKKVLSTANRVVKGELGIEDAGEKIAAIAEGLE